MTNQRSTPGGGHVEPDSFYDNAILTFVPGNSNGIPVKDYLVQWHDGDGWHRAVELKQFVILDKDNLHQFTEFGIPGRETGSSAFVPGHNDLEVLEMKVKIPKILRGHRYEFRVQASNLGGVSDWGYADGKLELPMVPRLGPYTRGKMHVKDWVMAKGLSSVAKAAGLDDIRWKLIEKYTMPQWAKKKKKKRFDEKWLQEHYDRKRSEQAFVDMILGREAHREARQKHERLIASGIVTDANALSLTQVCTERSNQRQHDHQEAEWKRHASVRRAPSTTRSRPRARRAAPPRRSSRR